MGPRTTRSRLPAALLALLIGIAATEAGARVALLAMGPPEVPVGLGAEDRRGTFYELVFEWDAELFFRLRPGLSLGHTENARIFDVHTDERGMRIRTAATPAPAPARTIVCVGDSCTFGSGAGSEGTFPAQLERLLAERPGGAARVLNAGVPGYGSYQGRKWLETQGFDLAPDVLIFTLGYNDAAPATAGPWRPMQDGAVLSDREYGAELRGFGRTGITRLFGRFLARRAPRDAPNPLVGVKTRASLADYRANLEAVIDGCRRRDCTPVIVVWPIRLQALPDANERTTTQLAEVYQRAAREVAAEQGVLLVDLVPLVAGRPEVFIDNVHMSPAGYGTVAAALADALATLD